MFGPLDSDIWRLWGEALALEVSAGRWLFVLLPGREKLLLLTLAKRSDMKKNLASIRTQRDPVAVLPRLYPVMVTFTDPSDPDTLIQVNPRQLSYRFGEWVRLGSLTVQRSDEAITTGKLRALIPWVCEALSQNILLGNEANVFRHSVGRVSIRPYHFMTGAC